MTGVMLPMSLEAMIWALEEAPDVPGHCLGTLMGLANHADKLGRGAYAGQKLIADYARKTDRQARSDLARLLELGVIRRGDQGLVSHIAPDARPVVYDLAMDRKQASARKQASGRNDSSMTTREQQEADQGEREGTGSTLPVDGAEAHFRPRPEADFRPEVQDRSCTSDKPMNSPSESSGKNSRPRKLNEGRDDAMRVCAHLADRIEDHGSIRPAITQEWLTEARLLMDKDKRTEAQVHKAIDWCQDSTFWRSNVMSMPTLREKYDQLRLKAEEERKRAADASAAAQNGSARHETYRNPPDQDAYETEELRPS